MDTHHFSGVRITRVDACHIRCLYPRCGRTAAAAPGRSSVPGLRTAGSIFSVRMSSRPSAMGDAAYTIDGRDRRTGGQPAILSARRQLAFTSRTCGQQGNVRSGWSTGVLRVCANLKLPGSCRWVRADLNYLIGRHNHRGIRPSMSCLCREPTGFARADQFLVLSQTDIVLESPPSRGRGLKHCMPPRVRISREVAPFAGARIETRWISSKRWPMSSPPSRGRGLKQVLRQSRARRGESPPSRGRGLKLAKLEIGLKRQVSPPSRGRGLKHLLSRGNYSGKLSMARPASAI